MKAFRVSVFLGCLCLGLASVHAVLMRPLGVEELTRKADLIVQGTVADKISLRDGAGRIYTKINIRVGEVWKGSLLTNAVANVLTIVQGGGTVGDEHAEVSGEAAYESGEEFVAFLVLNPRGEPVTIGLAQGKFHVWQDKQTGEKFAHNLFHGAAESAGTNNAAGWRVGDLKQQVHQATP